MPESKGPPAGPMRDLLETLVKATVCKMGNWEGIMDQAKAAGLFQPDPPLHAEATSEPDAGTLTTDSGGQRPAGTKQKGK